MKDVLNELLAEKSFLAADDPRIERMKRETAPILYDFKNYSGKANLTNQTLTLRGTIPLENLHVPDQSYCPAGLTKGLSINAWLNADLKGLLQSDIHFKNYFLEKDILLKYYHGYVAVESGELISQYEPVITYEYNDEFEKVEHIEQKEVKVPEITVSLKGNAPALLRYLQKQNVISTDELLSRELFPLYAVYSNNNMDLLQLSTSEERVLPELSPVRGPYFLFADIDFNQIRKQKQFAFLDSYIAPLSRLKLKGTKQDAKTGKIELELLCNHF
ncbi:hypothetical protein TH53_11770 [Pedobacter lusitanus]|uniref:Uncharacterized protein n=1 Tax=Pedobacter lusitanus TaxID=1503925 RepID=A0A0D0GID5_9SPHI|nr:hypothetical protein [Pedobacter lusitanus]KIO77037.1 hypothetical protein TH53_11770 [Pedobacter lusitanus]